MVARFTGTCEELTDIDVDAIAAWISSIDFEAWPQQHRLADGKLRPAMACDPYWFGFKARTDPCVDVLMQQFPGCIADTRMLSAVMPGHEIPAHRDAQSADWRCRVHLPLLSNEHSLFLVGGTHHHLQPGKAYRVNTEAEHAVSNHGPTARVHFMFDVRLASHQNTEDTTVDSMEDIEIKLKAVKEIRDVEHAVAVCRAGQVNEATIRSLRAEDAAEGERSVNLLFTREESVALFALAEKLLGERVVALKAKLGAA